MSNKIRPQDQSVSKCLSNRRYYIDFYQREYVWNSKTVKRLLDDIFYPFELSYEQLKSKDLTPAVLDKYNWYYLNIFITNDVDGKLFIVDGQQRLTTLTLIAAKLYHLTNNQNLKGSLKNCIYGESIWGKTFCIDSDKRKDVMTSILEEKEFEGQFKNKTEETIIERYADINKFFDDKKLDEKKLDTFIYYFLERLVLVEMLIEKDDTPMIFEVINDRGEALKPFEILKGKLIGLLSKDDTEHYSSLWDNAFNQLRDKEDEFFSDYIKSQFVYKRNSKQETAINNIYHRYIFEENEIAKALGFRRQDDNHLGTIKKFISVDLTYYASLYAKIRKNEDVFLSYNHDINDRDSQYYNIMAACGIKDDVEDDKIRIISKEIDRLYVLLVLNGLYDSNSFQELSYSLNQKLKGESIDKYRSIFNGIIENEILENRKINQINSLLDYEHFLKKDYSNTNIKFLRYFFARVENYICGCIHQTPQDTVQYIATKTGDITGYHIEHILSRNETNLGYFSDEIEFNSQRNVLGGLLLLKNRNNIASKNEEFSDKLKTYSNGLVYGHTLCSDFYHCNKYFDDFNEELFAQTGCRFEPFEKFDKIALEKRSKLLYQLVKRIWEVEY